VIPGEDDLLDLLLLVPLGDQVAPQDFQPAFPRPDRLPQVGRAVPARRFTGLPAAPRSPPVEGQETPWGPFSFVTMCTSLLLTAKWTSAPFGNDSSGSAPAPFRLRQPVEAVLVDGIVDLCVKSVLSSTVATGTPLRKSTRSMQFSLCSE
jgi:hypothetical protein